MFDITSFNGHPPKYEFDDGFIRYVNENLRKTVNESNHIQSPKTIPMQHYSSFDRGGELSSGLEPDLLTVQSVQAFTLLCRC